MVGIVTHDGSIGPELANRGLVHTKALGAVLKAALRKRYVTLKAKEIFAESLCNSTFFSKPQTLTHVSTDQHQALHTKYLATYQAVMGLSYADPTKQRSNDDQVMLLDETSDLEGKLSKDRLLYFGRLVANAPKFLHDLLVTISIRALTSFQHVTVADCQVMYDHI